MKINKSNKYLYIAIGLLALLCLLLTGLLCANKLKNQSTPSTEELAESDKTIDIKVSENSLSEYVIVADGKSEEAAKNLQKYICYVTGYKLELCKSNPKDKYIKLEVDKGSSKIEIKDGNIFIAANNKEEIEKQVNVFANTYLGYSFAGESREHILEHTEYINIPFNKLEADEPWMEKREPIICLWKTDAVRGVYKDPNVSLKSEILSYSDDQLYNYVKMMKYSGFSGIQVTDMCSTWAQYGGYEFVHQRIRFMADAAHSLGMDFTLWVWGAEFDGYGWTDDEVVYFSDNMIPRENPKVQAVFDKYYSIYAELADCSDRVIMHFNDPGNLNHSQDIGYYAAVFRDKCISINPDIDFGISCYTYQIALEDLNEHITEPFTVYCGAAKYDSEAETVAAFRENAKGSGLMLGVWSWNLCEMEIDQLAEMNVNPKIISDTYKRSQALDVTYKPNYWSEMDSYHLVNIFSLYCAGQMLIDPNLDPDEALHDISMQVVGQEYEADLFEILDIIQDARSGETFPEFKNGYEEHILYSDNYPAEEILARTNEAIPKLDAMIAADIKSNTIPLPVSVTELLSLVRPHLEEIKEYAEFRIMLSQAEEMYSNNQDITEIKAFIDSNYEPVKEYNTVVGSWGGAEANAQGKLLLSFCEKVGIEAPQNPVVDYYRKERILGEFISFQKKNNECEKRDKETTFQLGMAFTPEETKRLVNELILEGILSEDAEGRVYLTNWENYKFD